MNNWQALIRNKIAVTPDEGILSAVQLLDLLCSSECRFGECSPNIRQAVIDLSAAIKDWGATEFK